MPKQYASCGGSAWDFSRVEELWARFSPLTPYGKDAKEERRVYRDRDGLERLYDGTDDAAWELGSYQRPTLDRITYHLRRLPRLPFTRSDGGQKADGASLEIIEVFQVKKFLSNYKAIVGLCDERIRRRFGLEFRSWRLAALLDQGGSDPETFYIADSYHPSLPPLRAQIAEADEALRKSRAAAKSAALVEQGLDFGPREFLVLPHEKASGLLACGSGPRYAVEAYDGRSCVVRLQDGPEALLLAEKRDELAAGERELEAESLAAISRSIWEDSADLLSYAGAICEYDLARARAALAAELGCARPILGSAALVVERGRFSPLEADCERLSMAYEPLSARVEESVAVLFGSNMGGKTVALQSLLFFQIAAQAGLFVPAERFESGVYPAIRYIGELRGPAEARGGQAPTSGFADASRDMRDARDGLSGFGFEIRAFVDAWNAAREGGAFLVFDEFARTTSSAEAEAILSAAIGALVAMPLSRALFSTHFRGVERRPGARYLRMRGLDRAAAERGMLSGEPVAERIRRINRMMRYEILEADEEIEGSDAIAIASLLGLDEGIAAAASEAYSARGSGAHAKGKDI